MLIADKGDIQAGAYKLIPPNLLLHVSTSRLFKSTSFKSCAIFPCEDQLQSAKISTLTEYDPIFLIISQAHSLISYGENRLKQLDEVFSPIILEHFKDKAISICDHVESSGDNYYKVSQTKILELLEKRFETFVDKLSKSGIRFKTSKLEKEGDLHSAKIYAIDIMKKDVHLDFMNKIVHKLKISSQNQNPVFLDTFPDKESERKTTTNYFENDNFKKTSAVNLAPRLSARDEKLKKSAAGTNTLFGFLSKKKTETAPVQSQTPSCAPGADCPAHVDYTGSTASTNQNQNKNESQVIEQS